MANRLAGYLARPDPDTQVAGIIVHIPQALAYWEKIGSIKGSGF